MKFGLWYDFRNPPQWLRPPAELYAQTLDQIALAEELGFDDIWLSEHHFMEDGYLPSCLPVAAAIAVKTTRVTIGTNVLLTPFHNPIRLAEDCAVVDILSNGRFVLGAAVAYRLEEFATFGVNRRQRGSITEESVEIMRRCWTEEEFSHHGRHFHYEGVRCFPKPIQQPIPVWFGAAQGEAIRRAARQGDGLLGGGPARAAYVEALREYGKDAGAEQVASSTSWLFCSEDPKRDWEILKSHALYQLQNYAAWFKAAGQPAFGDPPKDFTDLESRGIYQCDTPQRIIESIQSAHEVAPFSRHFFWAVWPGVDPAMATRSIELFAQEVIPKLRNL